LQEPPIVAPVGDVKYAAQLTAPHSLSGSVLPGTLVHVPSLPATLHARHVPVQALVQHTPSTHESPVAHSLVEPHAAPVIPRDVQTPPLLQNAVGSQSASLAHMLAQTGAVWSAALVHVTDGYVPQVSATRLTQPESSDTVEPTAHCLLAVQTGSTRSPWQVVALVQVEGRPYTAAAQSLAMLQQSPPPQQKPLLQ